MSLFLLDWDSDLGDFTDRLVAIGAILEFRRLLLDALSHVGQIHTCMSLWLNQPVGSLSTSAFYIPLHRGSAGKFRPISGD